jgi:hypothetical protein
MAFASMSIRIQRHSEQSDLMKLPSRRAELPGDVDIIIIRSALTPVLESVTALPAPAYRQEGEASSRLARESYEDERRGDRKHIRQGPTWARNENIGGDRLETKLTRW